MLWKSLRNLCSRTLFVTDVDGVRVRSSPRSAAKVADVGLSSAAGPLPVPGWAVCCPASLR